MVCRHSLGRPATQALRITDTQALPLSSWIGSEHSATRCRGSAVSNRSEESSRGIPLSLWHSKSAQDPCVRCRGHMQDYHTQHTRTTHEKTASMPTKMLDTAAVAVLSRGQIHRLLWNNRTGKANHRQLRTTDDPSLLQHMLSVLKSHSWSCCFGVSQGSRRIADSRNDRTSM